jgi:sugar phosphate isomerase/epimerase
MDVETNQRPGIVIVASAFGAEAIRRDGHAIWAATAARAGAAGFEVRRELFANDADIARDALQKLGETIRALGLWAVYSTPTDTFSPDGTLDRAAVTRAIDEAAALGARIVKLQLGGADPENGQPAIATDPATIDWLLNATHNSPARVVVENGQPKAGGTIRAFEQLFAALESAQPEHLPLTMTFDTGNWLWALQDPADAARRLAPFVTYVHCKAVTGEGARRFACAPHADDARFAALLASLPRNVPRGIEFPFDTAQPDADAARYVAWLAAA